MNFIHKVSPALSKVVNFCNLYCKGDESVLTMYVEFMQWGPSIKDVSTFFAFLIPTTLPRVSFFTSIY